MREEDIVEIDDCTQQQCIDIYSAFLAKLEENKGKRILIFHIFTGHGALKESHQSILLNSYDPEIRFYERFEAEKWVKKIAQKCPNTYNVAIFGNHRDPEQQ